MNPRVPTGLMPADSASGATLHTIVAVMSFLACLALGGVLTLGRLATQWTDGLSGSVTVQLLPSPQISPDDQVKEAVRLVSQWPGVFSVHALTQADANKLLEPWLGTGTVLEFEELATIHTAGISNLAFSEDLSIRLANTRNTGLAGALLALGTTKDTFEALARVFRRLRVHRLFLFLLFAAKKLVVIFVVE